MSPGLSFDFWNTIYAPGQEPRRHALRVERFKKEAGRHRPLESAEIEQAFAASTAHFFREWQEKCMTPTAPVRIKMMAAMLGIQFSEEQLNDLVAYFGGLIFEVPPDAIPRIEALLHDLSRDYPLGIISDTGYISGKYIRAFLAEKNLLSCFTSLVFSDEETYSKPHVSLFQKTAGNLGVGTVQMIHTGDLEQTDVAGARNAGCKCIKFIGVNNADDGGSAADRIIDSYENFKDALQDMIPAIPVDN